MMKFQSPDFILHPSDFRLPSAAIRQLVSKGITTEGEIIDVFTAAGLTPSRPRSVGLRPALHAVCLGRPACSLG